MGRRGLAAATAALLFGQPPVSVQAQASGQPPPAPAQSPAPSQSPAPPQAGEEKPAPKLPAEQIEALVAPIALYPDPLLSQALMASTYPLEIIQAQQWLAKNSKLEGDELEKAVKAQDWEPAVQATVMVPDLLKRLAEDISWTTNLGNAFLAQQQDVMDAVQRLRTKAKEAGKLESNDKMKVETKVVEQQTVVVIEPASPEVVYVPAYNPTVIWGPPVVYAYPPVYYPPPPPPGAMFFSFSVGVMMGAAFHGGYCCGCGWGHNNTVVVNNRNTFVNNRNVQNNVRPGSGSSSWQHSPQHRGGAPYGDRATATKYGGGTRGDARASTMNRGGQGGSSRGGPGASTLDRGGQGASSRGGPGASTMDRGAPGASGMGGGGSGRTSDMSRGGGTGGGNIGNRSVPPSSGGSAFGGAGGGGDRAMASSSRGGSSMSGGWGAGGRGGGGRGGGGRGGGRR